MKHFIMVMAIGLGIFSCTHKRHTTIAIDVLLIPSETVYSKSLQLNGFINKNNPETLKLDKDHVPHITLLQCFIYEEDLPKVNNALEGLFQTIAKDSLKAERLSYDPSLAMSFAMISVKRSDALVKLHEKTIALLKPYIVKNGSKESFVQNPDGSPISKSTVAYVPVFVDQHSYQNYDPHISLGVAQKNVLDSLAKNVFEPIKFKAQALCVYRLGDHGTAQKLLWKAE